MTREQPMDAGVSEDLARRLVSWWCRPAEGTTFRALGWLMVRVARLQEGQQAVLKTEVARRVWFLYGGS